MAYVPTIGAELEGGFVDEQGEPADTQQVLAGGWKSKTRRFEETTRDMGMSSIEFVTCICNGGLEIGSSLERCVQAIPSGYRTLFAPRPFKGLVEIAEKPRTTAMREALAREQIGSICGIDKVAPWNATHFHVGVSDIYDPASVLLLNLLNNSASYARLKILDRCDVYGAAGHLDIWQGWCAREERVPAPRWFDSAVQMIGFVSEIPKLVMQVNGVWQPGDGTPSALGDPESEGTLWWMARPRGIYDTIEWRPFPSLEPSQVVILADEILRLARHYWLWVEEHPKFDGGRASSYVSRLYRYLSADSILIPPEPLTDGEWWALYSK